MSKHYFCSFPVTENYTHHFSLSSPFIPTLKYNISKMYTGRYTKRRTFFNGKMNSFTDLNKTHTIYQSIRIKWFTQFSWFVIQKNIFQAFLHFHCLLSENVSQTALQLNLLNSKNGHHIHQIWISYITIFPRNLKHLVYENHKRPLELLQQRSETTRILVSHNNIKSDINQ
jgi:hypothetical protein